jgi:hypothetical protein
MDGQEMNANIQFVIQYLLMIYYLVQELKMENVFHLIIVLAIQDIHHLTVLYIIVMKNYLMIRQSVLVMETVLHQIIVNVMINMFMKIANIQFVLVLHQMKQ